MRAYLRTRGTDRDYDFIGAGPAEYWWRAYRDRDLTDPEKPVVLAESDGGRWRIYLQGVESGRTDNRGTPIVYGMALEGDAGSDAALAYGTVKEWLTAITTASLGLGEALDKTLGPVDPLLETGRREDGEDAVRAVFAPAEPVTGDGPARWLGDIAVETDRAAFLEAVAGLLTGRDGRAVVLTYAGTEADVAALAADAAGDLAVLVARPNREIAERRRPLGKARPVHREPVDRAEPRPTPLRRPRRPAMPPGLTLALLSLAVAAASVMLWEALPFAHPAPGPVPTVTHVVRVTITKTVKPTKPVASPRPSRSS